MAGRPRAMIKKVCALELQAGSLIAEIFMVAPERSRSARVVPDELGQAWAEAIDFSMYTSICLENIERLMRAKAGLLEKSECEESGEEIKEAEGGSTEEEVEPHGAAEG